MFYKEIPLIIPIVRKATSANTFTVKSQTFQRNSLIRISHIVVCNNTTSSKLAHIGVLRNEHPIYIKSLVLTTATYYYKAILDILIPSDYRLIVKLITPTSGDLYYINVFGVIQELVPA